MELKDNFTNRYFKPDLVKTQVDMINQPTTIDSYADAFTQAGKGAANGPADHEANAVMLGFGAGLKGHANNKRQEKLDPILKQAGQINAQAAYLEAQMQQEQQETMQVQQFLKSNSWSFLEGAKAITANDIPAVNNIMQGVWQNYKQFSGDPVAGDFDHYHNGNIYYVNNETGEQAAVNIPQLIAQSGQSPEEFFGPDYAMVMSAYSPGFKGNYDNAMAMQQLTMDKERAGIDQTKAHTGLYDSQAGKIEQEMNAPKPKYDDSTLSHIRKANADWVTELNNKHKDAKKAIKAQIQMRDVIQKEMDEGNWQLGSSVLAQAVRWFNEKDGDNKAQQLIELKRQPLFKDLKNTFGARITDNDLATWLTTQVDLSTQPNLAIEVLNERIEDAESEMQEELLRRKILENEFQNSESHYSHLVDERVEEELENLGQSHYIPSNQSNAQDQDMIQVKSPTGKIGMIPRSSLSTANGYVVMDE